MKTCHLFVCLAIACVTFHARAQAPVELTSSWKRAGNPQESSHLARPGDSGGFIGYYVGGGAVSVRRGDGPFISDGTWGWDFQGKSIMRRVNLPWWHGRRSQGGVGAYKTDGPTLPFHR